MGIRAGMRQPVQGDETIKHRILLSLVAAVALPAFVGTSFIPVLMPRNVVFRFGDGMGLVITP